MKSYNKYYYEKYAQLTLINILGFNDKTLFLDDKPDLQDNSQNIGIEVVQDTYQTEKQLENFWHKYEKTAVDLIPKKQIAGYYKLGGKLTIKENRLCGGALGPSTPNNPEHLIFTIQHKQKKLNAGGYKRFKTYGLFVFVETVFPLFDSYIDTLIKETNSKALPLNYTQLYLFCYYEFILIDMSQQSFKHYDISSQMRDKISKEAYKYSQKMEK